MSRSCRQTIEAENLLPNALPMAAHLLTLPPGSGGGAIGQCRCRRSICTSGRSAATHVQHVDRERERAHAVARDAQGVVTQWVGASGIDIA